MSRVNRDNGIGEAFWRRRQVLKALVAVAGALALPAGSRPAFGAAIPDVGSGHTGAPSIGGMMRNCWFGPGPGKSA